MDGSRTNAPITRNHEIGTKLNGPLVVNRTNERRAGRANEHFFVWIPSDLFSMVFESDNQSHQYSRHIFFLNVQLLCKRI